jgi:uncharacterized protein
MSTPFIPAWMMINNSSKFPVTTPETPHPEPSSKALLGTKIDWRAELCFGRVMHKRFRPAVHQFSYGVFFLRVPLSQLPTLRTMSSLSFRFNGFGLLGFRERDYGPRDGSSLETWARRLLAEANVQHADGEIVLQSFPRLLGYVFNPITIWYCHDKSGALRAAIAEVNNTFGERHNYVIAHDDGRVITPDDWLIAKKVFHVSPFCEVRGYYRFRFEQTFEGDASRVFAQIDFFDGANDADKLIVTTMHGAPKVISPATARLAFLRYPLMTLGVIARIHWQAIKLWRKNVPFFTKPSPPQTETTRSL